MQIPCLFPALTIAEAGEIARQKAFEQWNPNEGWHSHQAAIMPVTKAFFKLALEAYLAGGIEDVGQMSDDDEPPQCFNFTEM